MVKRSRSEFLLNNLPQLQNLIKRDPVSYKQEFTQQWQHYESALSIFCLKPDSESTEFSELISFISHIASCYPKECSAFPNQLMDLLSNHYQILNPDLRKTMVQALVLMRNKDLISPTSLLSLFFTLFRCKDKQLRVLLHSHIVADIKNANRKAKNNKLNKTLQNFMFTMLNDSSDIASKKSLDVMIDLYRKNVWNDAKTVNIIAQACFSDVAKISATALKFFLNLHQEKEEEEDGDVPDLSALQHTLSCNKKTKARKAQLEKALSTIKKKEKKKAVSETFNALHLINDPQEFAEKLLSRLRQVTSTNKFRFELRIHFINLISRLVGTHKLLLLHFYEFLIPYLKAHQKEVTSIIAYTAQACHELVPPDVLETVLRALADNFVWSNCASEVVTVGLNGMREICSRCPLAMPEQLLQSLLEDYKNHREKGPMNAARSLLALYREVNPTMLRKKDRGKKAAIAVKSFQVPQYGQVHVPTTVEGADLLDQDEDAPELVEDESLDLEDLDDDLQELEEDDEIDDEEEEEYSEDDETQDYEQEEKETVKEESPKKKVKLGLSVEKIFTDEDFKKIKQLKMKQDVQNVMGTSRAKQTDSSDDETQQNEFLDETDIMAGTRKKNDYQARMESIKSGREGREFGSKKGKKEQTSITNKRKAKTTKNFMMIVHKRDVKNKARRSLREKQKILRSHIKKQKMKK